MPDACEQLDRQYLEMRWRILALAADFDRLQRMPNGDAALADRRVAALRACVNELLSDEARRAERVQMILSDRIERSAVAEG